VTRARSPRLGLTGFALLALTLTYCGSSKPASPAQPSPPAPAPAPAGTFAIACGSDVLDLGWSGSVTRACSVTSNNGFDGDVALTCTGLTGASCSFAPATVHPTGGASISATMTITYADEMPFGGFPHDPRGCGDPNLEYMGGNGVSTYLTLWVANQGPSGFVTAQERTGLLGPLPNLCTSRFCDAQSCLALPR
jgi:hypothetical protein